MPSLPTLLPQTRVGHTHRATHTRASKCLASQPHPSLTYPPTHTQTHTHAIFFARPQ